MIIRGHHLGCVYCYLGSGKSNPEEFFGVANAIPDLLARLQADPELEVTVAADLDEVCDLCPLSVPHGCGRGKDPVAQNDKLRSWDRAILDRLGLVPGDRTTARQIEQLMRERIPDIGEICTNCTSASGSGWREYQIGIGKGLWGCSGKSISVEG